MTQKPPDTMTVDAWWFSPRDYLKGKSWDEKVRVGRRALEPFGALKP